MTSTTFAIECNSVKKSFSDVRTQVAALNNFVQEHLSGIRIVQMFNREDKEMQRFDQINKLHMQANVRSVWYYSIFFPVVEILSAISIGLLNSTPSINGSMS